MTALHVAIYRGAPEVAELLLDAGARTDIRDKVKSLLQRVTRLVPFKISLSFSTETTQSKWPNFG